MKYSLYHKFYEVLVYFEAYALKHLGVKARLGQAKSLGAHLSLLKHDCKHMCVHTCLLYNMYNKSHQSGAGI